VLVTIVNPRHMHTISDGERRRVQLTMGLMAPWDVLLLDEVTVDLDVLVRDELLTFLKEESEKRGATILYATHIFDGLNNFPTHIAHMRDGYFAAPPTPWPFADELEQDRSSPTLANVVPGRPIVMAGSSLHSLALGWLKEDREIRIRAEKSGERAKTRGPRYHAVPTESETFYRKYDYTG